MDYAFKKLHIPILHAEVKTINTASLAVVQKLGMIEGKPAIKEYVGELMNMRTFSITREQYLANHP